MKDDADNSLFSCGILAKSVGDLRGVHVSVRLTDTEVILNWKFPNNGQALTDLTHAANSWLQLDSPRKNF